MKLAILVVVLWLAPLALVDDDEPDQPESRCDPSDQTCLSQWTVYTT